MFVEEGDSKGQYRIGRYGFRSRVAGKFRQGRDKDGRFGDPDEKIPRHLEFL